MTAGDDGTLRIWDASTGAPRAMYDAHPGRIDKIALTPDGMRVVTAGDDGYARVFPIGIEHVERVVLEHCGLAALIVGICPLVSADAAPSRQPYTPPALASCDRSEADFASLWTATDTWSTSSSVISNVTLRWQFLHRTIQPQLDLRVRRDGQFEQVWIGYKGQGCQFRGCMKDGVIVLAPSQMSPPAASETIRSP